MSSRIATPRRAATLTGLTGALVVALAAGAVAQELPRGQEDADEDRLTMALPIASTVKEVTDKPSAFHGRSLSVMGTIANVDSAWLVTLDGEGEFAGTEMAVLLPAPHGELPEGEEVRVTGVFEYLSSEKLEQMARRHGREVELGQQEKVPVMIATSVETAAGAEFIEGADLEKMTRVQPEDIVRNPERYYGKLVTVTSEIEESHGPRILMLDEEAVGEGPDLMVLIPWRFGTVLDEQRITVRGTVHAIDPKQTKTHWEWPDVGLEPDDVAYLPMILADSLWDLRGGQIDRRRPQTRGGHLLSLLALHPEPEKLVGEVVREYMAKVVEVRTPRLVKIANAHGQSMWLVLAETVPGLQKLDEGDSIDVSAVVMRPPEDPKKLGLSPEAREVLHGKDAPKVFLFGTRLAIRGEI